MDLGGVHLNIKLISCQHVNITHIDLQLLQSRAIWSSRKRQMPLVQDAIHQYVHYTSCPSIHAIGAVPVPLVAALDPDWLSSC